MLGYSSSRSQDRSNHRTRSARRSGVVRVPGDRFQSMHRLRRVFPRVPDGRHPDDNGWCGPKIVSLSCTPPAFSVEHA